jgi:hypothetical protein
MRGVVKYLREINKGGVLLPDGIYEKTGLSAMEVLQSKHPGATSPFISYLRPYVIKPDFCNLDVTQDKIEQVAHDLFGSSGMGGVD